MKTTRTRPAITAVVLSVLAIGRLAVAAPPDAAPPAVAPAAGPLRLTLSDAVARGLEHNLQAVLAAQTVEAASGAREVALSGLLPTVEAAVIASRQKISLEEYGLSVPGESPLVGPYDVVRGQLSVTQVLFSLAAIGHARAGTARLDAARLGWQDARDLVVTACSAAYLQAVAADSRVAAARAQLATAEALATRARDLRQAGTVAGIEVLRADVQLAAQKQRLIQATNELDRARLMLARAVGLPLGEPFVLADAVPYSELDPGDLDDALVAARAQRPDLLASRALLRASEAAHQAEVGEGLPSLVLNGNVARVGPTVETTKSVYSVMAGLRVPLFQGGRTQGRLRQSRAEEEQQRARLADLEVRVELEVRTAFFDLKAAAEQVGVARGARALAGEQLTQAEDRFAAGVASNIEVVQAQQAVAEAEESYIASLYAHNLAKLALVRAQGAAEMRAGQVLGGGR